MKYSEYKKRENYDVPKYNFLTYDLDDNEFVICDGCNAEAPLHLWNDWRESRQLCELCSNSGYSEMGTSQNNNTANLILKSLGYFDNYSVIVLEEDVRGDD